MSYQFKVQLVTPEHKDVFHQAFSPLVKQKNLHYLEVGAFEGQSLIWILDHIFKRPTHRASIIDAFLYDSEDRFRHNLKLAGHGRRVKVIKEMSRRALVKFKPESLDAIYIDGGHTMSDVLSDAVMAWAALKYGGVMIFDDYLFRVNEVPVDMRPQAAIDAFLTAYRNELELLHRGYIVAVRKIPPVRPKSDTCSYFAKLVFDWSCDRILGPRDEIRLTRKEVKCLKGLLGKLEVGATDLDLQDAHWRSGEAKRLLNKLSVTPEDFLSRGTQPKRFEY